MVHILPYPLLVFSFYLFSFCKLPTFFLTQQKVKFKKQIQFMKQIFEEPLMEVINFSIYDVIVTSGDDDEEEEPTSQTEIVV